MIIGVNHWPYISKKVSRCLVGSYKFEGVKHLRVSHCFPKELKKLEFKMLINWVFSFLLIFINFLGYTYSICYSILHSVIS